MKGYIKLTNGEVMDIELFEDTPITSENFKKLANSGFYDGLTFHRVIPGFVSQGGCPIGNGTGGPGYTIPCETKNNPHIHKLGASSMAHRGKDTGGSQFFICHDSFPHLDGVHTVFGQVTSNVSAAVNMNQGQRIESIRIHE